METMNTVSIDQGLHVIPNGVHGAQGARMPCLMGKGFLSSWWNDGENLHLFTGNHEDVIALRGPARGTMCSIPVPSFKAKMPMQVCRSCMSADPNMHHCPNPACPRYGELVNFELRNLNMIAIAEVDDAVANIPYRSYGKGRWFILPTRDICPPEVEGDDQVMLIDIHGDAKVEIAKRAKPVTMINCLRWHTVSVLLFWTTFALCCEGAMATSPEQDRVPANYNCLTRAVASKTPNIPSFSVDENNDYIAPINIRTYHFNITCCDAYEEWQAVAGTTYITSAETMMKFRVAEMEAQSRIEQLIPYFTAYTTICNDWCLPCVCGGEYNSFCLDLGANKFTWVHGFNYRGSPYYPMNLAELEPIHFGSTYEFSQIENHPLMSTPANVTNLGLSKTIYIIGSWSMWVIFSVSLFLMVVVPFKKPYVPASASIKSAEMWKRITPWRLKLEVTTPLIILCTIFLAIESAFGCPVNYYSQNLALSAQQTRQSLNDLALPWLAAQNLDTDAEIIAFANANNYEICTEFEGDNLCNGKYTVFWNGTKCVAIDGSYQENEFLNNLPAEWVCSDNKYIAGNVPCFSEGIVDGKPFQVNIGAVAKQVTKAILFVLSKFEYHYKSNCRWGSSDAYDMCHNMPGSNMAYYQIYQDNGAYLKTDSSCWIGPGDYCLQTHISFSQIYEGTTQVDFEEYQGGISGYTGAYTAVVDSHSTKYPYGYFLFKGVDNASFTHVLTDASGTSSNRAVIITERSELWNEAVLLVGDLKAHKASLIKVGMHETLSKGKVGFLDAVKLADDYYVPLDAFSSVKADESCRVQLAMTGWPCPSSTPMATGKFIVYQNTTYCKCDPPRFYHGKTYNSKTWTSCEITGKKADCSFDLSLSVNERYNCTIQDWNQESGSDVNPSTDGSGSGSVWDKFLNFLLSLFTNYWYYLLIPIAVVIAVIILIFMIKLLRKTGVSTIKYLAKGPKAGKKKEKLEA